MGQIYVKASRRAKSYIRKSRQANSLINRLARKQMKKPHIRSTSSRFSLVVKAKKEIDSVLQKKRYKAFIGKGKQTFRGGEDIFAKARTRFGR
jgi:archaeosine-15-forming tRNA-guanine transglycosylase